MILLHLLDSLIEVTAFRFSTFSNNLSPTGQDYRLQMTFFELVIWIVDPGILGNSFSLTLL